MNIRNIIGPAAIALMLVACRSNSQKPETPAAPSPVQTEEASTSIPDFRMNDIDGNEVSALEEAAKHKITVIDFWASWCGPCLREMPEVVGMYNKYKDKGLGIIGVSLDKDATSWKEAVKRMDMKWVQVSDLQGWDNAAAQMFGVQSIPFTVIIDREGKLIDAGLRGSELEQRVGEILEH
ncbi:peroxiredoxin family protein [Xylanibacter caecicola]|uniref:peroxiredoxin family protein n=1 Tax=Xylanibacter caecicola TaxID=2736294 RepID=UPI00258EA8A8|nr:TlpA disulfide reductase family protein [Xylanibacter caecicola]